MIPKYGFIFYSIGNVLSDQNKKFMMQIISFEELNNIEDQVGFDQVLSVGLFFVSVFISYQIGYKKIIFRNMICLFERYPCVMSLENSMSTEGIKQYNYCVNNPYYYYHLWDGQTKKDENKKVK